MGNDLTHGARRRSVVAPRLLIATAALTCALAVIAGVSLVAAPAVDVIDAERGRIRALEERLLTIDARAASAAADHSAALAQIAELRRRQTVTAADMVRARADRREALARLSDRIVALYTTRTPSLVEVVVATGGLTAAIDAQRSLAAIARADRGVVDRIDAGRARLATLAVRLRADRRAAERTAEAAAGRMAELDGLLASRRSLLTAARDELDVLITARRRAALVAAGREAESAIRRRAAAPAPTPEAAAAAPEAPATTAPPPRSVADALERIAQCESGGNPRIVSASGQYRGKYQFSLGTWAAVGGTGDPAAASEAEQDRRAAILYARSGPAPWPICGYR